ncbi:hypothetical protein QL285_061091 [Trifolium repens]|nr:hypothetical protein QL285_061052 [Trifolium repens]KAK2387274.1 hypothetical protein QL285_061070 [Trifolium repens]KAK2387295.1 hypothetical protein QL285_061091 [Trifolium repens]
MVSSPWLRPLRFCSSSASVVVLVLEKFSIVHHKEIVIVLFDPPSFLMVYSNVYHLWRKLKMKKFLPLPPVRKSAQEPSIYIQAHLSDSIPKTEGEISTSSSIYVLKSITPNNN